MNKEQEKFDKILIVGSNPCECKDIISYLDDIDVFCECASDLTDAKVICESYKTDYYTLILINEDMPYVNFNKTAQGLEEIGVTSPVTSLLPCGKKFENIMAYEFYFHLAPYIENALRFIISLKNALEMLYSVPNVDVRICNVYFGVSNMGCDMDIFLKYFERFKVNNCNLHIRLRELMDNSCFDEAATLCSHVKEITAMLGLINTCRSLANLEHAIKDPAYAAHSGQWNSYGGIKDLLYSLEKNLAAVCQIQF